MVTVLFHLPGPSRRTAVFPLPEVSASPYIESSHPGSPCVAGMMTATHFQMGKGRPMEVNDSPKFAELVGNRVTLCTQPVGLGKP